MSDNLKEVLMAIIALVSAVVTPIVLVYVTRKQNEKIDANHTDLVDKVDTYHKEVNGGFSKLLETTKQLATATEKAKHEPEKKK